MCWCDIHFQQSNPFLKDSNLFPQNKMCIFLAGQINNKIEFFMTVEVSHCAGWKEWKEVPPTNGESQRGRSVQGGE